MLYNGVMTKTIIGLIGFIGAGKGTVADILREHHGFHTDSFAATLKDAVAPVFGWPRDMLEGDTPESREFREKPDDFWCEKLCRDDFTPRLALQLVGTDVFRNNFHRDTWIYSMERRLLETHSNVVISDVRFQNEISLIHDLGGAIIRVRRGPEPEWFAHAVKANAGNTRSRTIMQNDYSHVHASEWGWAGADPDYIIDNDSDLDSLNIKVEEILTQIAHS